MITSEEVKHFLRDTCEVEVVGIAPATPFSADDRERIVKTLETLAQANQRMGNTNVFDAKDFVDDAQAVIVFGRNSYFGSNPYGTNDGPHGAIGNFYLNQNILDRAVSQSEQVIEFLKSKGFDADSPFSGFPQKIKALEAGAQNLFHCSDQFTLIARIHGARHPRSPPNLNIVLFRAATDADPRDRTVPSERP